MREPKVTLNEAEIWTVHARMEWWTLDGEDRWTKQRQQEDRPEGD